MESNKPTTREIIQDLKDHKLALHLAMKENPDCCKQSIQLEIDKVELALKEHYNEL